MDLPGARPDLGPPASLRLTRHRQLRPRKHPTRSNELQPYDHPALDRQPYGHLLIGLSLISGLLVRVSAPFAIMLMLLYWTAHMDFPYIENANNFLIDYHIIYAGVLVYLMVSHAGRVCGLDAWASKRGVPMA